MRSPEQTREHRAIPENPYLSTIYSEITSKINSLKFKKDKDTDEVTLQINKEQELLAVAMLLEAAQRQFKATPEPQKAYFQIQEFISKIQKPEQLFELIDNINRAKFEQSFQVEDESHFEWKETTQDQIKRWKEGITKLKPEQFSAGDYVSFARIDQAKNPNEPVYFFTLSKDVPKMPPGVVGEAEYFQVREPKPGKLILEQMSNHISILDSSEKLKQTIIDSNPNLELKGILERKTLQDIWKNITVAKETSLDGAIQKDQLFVYKYFIPEGYASDSGVFGGKILGVNNEGNVIVQTKGERPQTFAIERNTWDKLLKTASEDANGEHKCIEYPSDENEMEKLLKTAMASDKKRKEALTFYENDPETQKINQTIFLNNIEKEFNNIKKGNITPEMLVADIFSRITLGTSEQDTAAKEILLLRLDMLSDKYKNTKPESKVIYIHESLNDKKKREDAEMAEKFKKDNEENSKLIAMVKQQLNGFRFLTPEERNNQRDELIEMKRLDTKKVA